MYKTSLERIMSNYLENRTNEDETQMLLNHLIESERDRHIINLAAAGLRCMQPDNRRNNEKQYDSRH